MAPPAHLCSVFGQGRKLHHRSGLGNHVACLVSCCFLDDRGRFVHRIHLGRRPCMSTAGGALIHRALVFYGQVAF
jgi:hypothetical protein